RSAEAQLFPTTRCVLEDPRSNPGEPPRAGLRETIPHRYLFPFATSGRDRPQLKAGAGIQWKISPSNRHGDFPGKNVLAGGRVSSAVSGEARSGKLSYLKWNLHGKVVATCESEARMLESRRELLVGLVGVTGLISSASFLAGAEAQYPPPRPTPPTGDPGALSGQPRHASPRVMSAKDKE